ncbi:MAG: response regulator [Flavobacteriales bacterium]|nr:response regulator [Flavobacteriales bacterium]
MIKPTGTTGTAAPTKLVALVVDDDEDLVYTMSHLVARKGFQVHNALNGAKALAKLPAITPQVVFLDIGLPDQSGYDVCKQLRQSPAGAEAYIVAVTGRDEPGDLLREANSGFDQHVTKPMTPAALNQILETVRIRQAVPRKGTGEEGRGMV